MVHSPWVLVRTIYIQNPLLSIWFILLGSWSEQYIYRTHYSPYGSFSLGPGQNNIYTEPTTLHMVHSPWVLVRTIYTQNPLLSIWFILLGSWSGQYIYRTHYSPYGSFSLGPGQDNIYTE